MRFRLLSFLVLPAVFVQAEIPESLMVEGIPEIPAGLKEGVGRYLEFRSASFQDWHPTRRQVLISTRFGETAQLHVVGNPGGARRQLTFLSEPVAGGRYHPRTGDTLVFAQDRGGGEFYQLYRYDLADGRVTLLTDGKSRNTGMVWSPSGRWIAYASTQRNGRDTDIRVMDPTDPKTDRLLFEVAGGGWSVADWSEDEGCLAVHERISINESYLHLVEFPGGGSRCVTPRGGEKVAYGVAQFASDGRSLWVTSDRGSEFRQVARLDLDTGRETAMSAHVPWDAEDLDVSPDGRRVAFLANEGGGSVLHVLDVRKGRELVIPRIPVGVIGGLKWHRDGRALAFTLSGARSPSDVYSVDLRRGSLERWTESETGGLDPERFVEPEQVRLKSFDGLTVTAFVYRPDPGRFPGRRPVLVNIHGGPEGQARPLFQARNNYYLQELGVAMVYPNVRGSSGYGKTFLTLDNGFRREDSVRDIGAVLDWIAADALLDAGRVAVVGGSYRGYMVLASLMHHGDRLRCGVDVVGISNFLTFLKNTQDYRRDLRRVEYGDERDPAMREFLGRISPTENVDRIRRPLFVVQGKNDPRVPVTESEQMVKALRDGGGVVWYLMAKDEGHGFAKKRNADYQFLATVLFLREQLLQ